VWVVADAATLISKLRLPEPALVREVWPSEPFHFTPWLGTHLELLEPLGLGPLELTGIEVAVPSTGRALDILARRLTGDLVAIENQFGKVDHDHLTRGLAYAVGLKAVALVVIAEEHLGEFRAVAGYLNGLAEKSSAEERVAVYLVELAVEAVEEYLVPRLTVVESPNAWLEAASGLRPPPGLADLDDFLPKVPEAAKGRLQEVAEWWQSQPNGTIRFGAQTAISLDRPHPRKPSRPLSHMLLYVSGNYEVQRGYLREAGVVSEERLAAFDDFLRRTFPDLRWTGKQYFLGSESPPSLAAVQAFVEWLEAEAGNMMWPEKVGGRSA
jgi:hypothetical protein